MFYCCHDHDLRNKILKMTVFFSVALCNLVDIYLHMHYVREPG
jgi:hypothetical protein